MRLGGNWVSLYVQKFYYLHTDFWTRKSQIALEYSFRRKETNPECSIFWVHAANLARFEETYSRIASECGLLVREDAQIDVLYVVQTWLETQHEGPWLMIIDNVDDAHMFFREQTRSGKTLSQYIPHTARGSLLFTTRNRDIAVDLTPFASPVEVPVFTKVEATQLVTGRMAKNEPEMNTLELLAELEYIPLAITQALAFMSKRRRSVAQYLELYRQSNSNKTHLLSYEFSDHARQYNSMESIAKTWTISFESIRNDNRRAANLLSLMSYFDSQSIPLDLLHQDDEDNLDFDDALAMLQAFSLIKSSDKDTKFDMHRLVQLATQLWLAEDNKGEDDKWAFEALKTLATVFPESTHHPRAGYWKRCASLLPHAEVCIRYHFKVTAKEAQLARANLLLKMARYICWQGDYTGGTVKFEESFKIRKEYLGEKHLDTLISMGQFAWALIFIDRENEAEVLGSRLLEMRQEVLGEDHPDTIDALSGLAMALQHQGKIEDTEVMHLKALEDSKRVLGPDHPDTINCVIHLAICLKDLRRYKEAENLLREVVGLIEKEFGCDSPNELMVWNELAVAIEAQGRNREAEDVYQHTLLLQEKVLGLDHPETLITLHNLILLLYDMDRYEDALNLAAPRLEGLTAISGKDSLDLKTKVFDLLSLCEFMANSDSDSTSTEGSKV
jgi:tetratricopeptide (TPR) repeat protein